MASKSLIKVDKQKEQSVKEDVKRSVGRPKKADIAVVKCKPEMKEEAMQLIEAVKDLVKPKKERAKRILTDEQKQALRERLVKAREAKGLKKKALD